TDGLDRGGQVSCDLVILAPGFGIERWVRRGDVPSYWRNDDLNQLRPGISSEKVEVFFVSGTGDGGLIDLLRCKIKGFNQAWIINDLFSVEYDLRLMAPAADGEGLPNRGRNLIVVASVDGELHFRIFDGKGNMINGRQ